MADDGWEVVPSKKKKRKQQQGAPAGEDDATASAGNPASIGGGQQQYGAIGDGLTTGFQDRGARKRYEDDHETRIYHGFSDHSGPVAIERYEAACRVINKARARRVADLGSGEGLAVPYVRDLCSHVHTLTCLDIDPAALQQIVRSAHPSTAAVPRDTPLEVTCVEGSFASQHVGDIQCDVALLIETIEHLDPPLLQSARAAVFGVLRPATAVVTTPNSEHNVVFNLLPGKWRHWDHRFEWTREEFQGWCREIGEEFGYTVAHTGVGQPPPAFAAVGPCSQIAVFTRCETDAPARASAALEDGRPQMVGQTTVHDMQRKGGGKKPGAQGKGKGKKGKKGR